MRKLWVIRYSRESGQEEPLWWSNDDGWVDARSATVFTDEQHLVLRLPLQGKWELLT